MTETDENLVTPDRIIRDLFADPENSRNFFLRALPPDLVDHLDLSRIETLPGSFIDEKLREYRSDILYRVPTNTANLTEVYLLFEHKSAPDPRIFFQLLGYLARIYESQEKPVPVIPLVFHHGQKGWTRSKIFLDEFDLTDGEREVFGKYIPGFQIEVFDLTEGEVVRFRESLLIYAFLSIIYHIDCGDLSENHLHGIFELTNTVFQKENGIAWFRKMVLYILKKGEMNPEDIRKPASRVSTGLESIVMTTAEKLINQGREEGIKKGIEQGIEQGIVQ